MLDIRMFRENPDAIRKDLEKRGYTEKIAWVDWVIGLDSDYRKLLKESEGLRAERNSLSSDINKAKKEGRDAKSLLDRAKEIPARIKEIETEQEQLRQEIKRLQMNLPNILHESVPVGKDDTENVQFKAWGNPKKLSEFGFDVRIHSEVIEALDGGDFTKATEVSGSGFYYLWGEFALLDQALQQFAIEILVKKGFKLVEPPLMLRRKAYEGVTDLSDFENVMYKIDGEDLYLIATSEHPIGALLMDETVDAARLPLLLAGTSPCFRKEIGSHGVDTKGLFRVHQFSKIEQFVFCRPQDSWEWHEKILANAEEIFQKLELPYRVVNICTGDMGTVASKKYDIEVWMPREEKYKEVVSCSNCTTYQAVRLNIRYKGKDSSGNDEKDYLHTLNSTAIATGRAIRAIIENFQNPDGTVNVPKALHPYMHGIKVIGKR